MPICMSIRLIISIGKNFTQYEVSNFCLHGFECRHNNAYWRYRDYLSFGTSAHSFADGKRWWNYSSLKKYIHEINLNEIAVAGYEIINGKQQLDEYIMLALRSAGLDTSDLKEKFGNDWIKEKYDYFIELKNQNLLNIDDHFIRLTNKGYALCDEILANLL